MRGRKERREGRYLYLGLIEYGRVEGEDIEDPSEGVKTNRVNEKRVKRRSHWREESVLT